MAITTANLQTFTDSEIVDVLRQAYVHTALSQSISTGDRALTRAKLSDIGKELKDWENRLDAQTNHSDIILTEFNRAI